MNDNLSPTTSEVLVRRLSRRYVLVLMAVAGLIGLNQALIQPMLVRMDGYAPAVAVAAAVVGLLVALDRFVVRPAVTAIRGKMDDLERHVALRTQELDATLACLRNEIAERKRSDARSKSLAAQLAHADRVESIGRLAAGLAHELNQPLGAIANYSQACGVILTQPLGDEAWSQLQGFTRQMERASLRAGGIVRRIRNFVQPGAGNKATVELTTLIREVIELCRGEAQRAEVELLLQPCDREIETTVDPIQIQQVLVNLIQNAVQASMHAPPQRRRVTVRIATANDAVQVDVVDRGPGLADADPEALFTPFHTTKSDGLGIGLSICRSIVEQHRGTIWARSLPAYGAQFSFVLPLSEEHAVEPAPRTDRICR